MHLDLEEVRDIIGIPEMFIGGFIEFRNIVLLTQLCLMRVESQL